MIKCYNYAVIYLHMSTEINLIKVKSRCLKNDMYVSKYKGKCCCKINCQ